MWALTTKQRELLTRWFDGELVGEDEGRRVETLLEEKPEASIYVSVLRELRTAARGAVQEVTERADLSEGHEVAEAARRAPPLSELSLDELEPLLMAYHDEAVTEPEARAVERVRDERPDVEAFLSGLESIGATVRVAASQRHGDLSDGELWSAIEEDLDRVDRERLVMRYVDDEITDEERRQVESLLESGDEEVTGLVEQLKELNLAVRAAHEETVDADLSQIWSGVDEALSDEWRDESSSSGVVSLDAARTERTSGSDEGRSTRESDDADVSGGTVVEFFSEYGQAMAGAAAAVVFMLVGGLLYQNFLVPQQAGPQKQVVIVDSVEERSSSVRVGSVQPTGTQQDSEESKVIWLSEKGKKATGDEKTIVGGPDAGAGVGEEQRTSRDWPDGGTPIERRKGEGVPAHGEESEVDKPGKGPI